MKTLLLTIAVLSLCIPVGAQTAETAGERIDRAIEMMDEGDLDGSIALLRSVLRGDRRNYRANYELGLAYYLKEEFDEAAKIFGRIENRPDADDRLYQMLGNSLHRAGDAEAAAAAYERGRKKYPLSGRLAMEIGIAAYDEERYGDALKQYEKGLRLDPSFASNWYRAADLLLQSNEPVWGLIYGEIYMNLVYSGDRFDEMSRRLGEAYNEHIRLENDTAILLAFSADNNLYVEDGLVMLPFGTSAFEPALALAVAQTGRPPFDLEQLCEIRSRFIDIYFDPEYDFSTVFPNLLFSRLRDIRDAGHLEAYDHWILGAFDDDAFYSWCEANTDKWDAFAEWMGRHPLRLSLDNRFGRYSYMVDPADYEDGI